MTIWERLHRVVSEYSRRQLGRSLRHLWQRWTRGFDDSETWSLDHSLAKLILPRLERYREIALTSLELDSEHEEALDRMVEAFRLVASNDYWTLSREQEARVDEGLRLFAESYRGLWW